MKIIIRNSDNKDMDVFQTLKLLSNYGAVKLENIGFYYDEFIKGADFKFDMNNDQLKILTDILNCFNVKYEIAR